MTHYLNGFTPDIECKRCDGSGWVPRRWAFNSRVQLTEEDCPDCCGHGWRPMTQGEIEDAAADAFSDMCEGEPPMSADGHYQRVAEQKRRLRS